MLQKILRNLDVAKVCRIDQISPKFLKYCAPALAIHLANVIKQIYLAFSFKIKIAKITSLFKRGIKTEDKKYTPISLMALMPKVIEKYIHDQTQDYLQINELLCVY